MPPAAEWIVSYFRIKLCLFLLFLLQNFRCENTCQLLDQRTLPTAQKCMHYTRFANIQKMAHLVISVFEVPKLKSSKMLVASRQGRFAGR